MMQETKQLQIELIPQKISIQPLQLEMLEITHGLLMPMTLIMLRKIHQKETSILQQSLKKIKHSIIIPLKEAQRISI